MYICSSIKFSDVTYDCLQQRTFSLIVGFTEMLALRNNGKLESCCSVLVIAQRGFCGSLNWRGIQSKDKSVCENAMTPI